MFVLQRQVDNVQEDNMSTAIIKNNIDIFANNLHEHIYISISNSQAPDNLKINKSIQKTNQKT